MCHYIDVAFTRKAPFNDSQAIRLPDVTSASRKLRFDFFEITSTISVHTDCLIKLLKSVPFGEVRILRYLRTLSRVFVSKFKHFKTSKSNLDVLRPGW